VYIFHKTRLFISKWHKAHNFKCTTVWTRSSAIAEGPRDASCQLKYCQFPRQQCINYLYDKSWTNRSYEVTGLQWDNVCNKHVHSTMTRSSRFHCPVGVTIINKPTTGKLWISPAYRNDRNCSRDPDHAHLGNTHSSQDYDFAWPTREQKLKSLAIAVAEILHGV